MVFAVARLSLFLRRWHRQHRQRTTGLDCFPHRRRRFPTSGWARSRSRSPRGNRLLHWRLLPKPGAPPATTMRWQWLRRQQPMRSIAKCSIALHRHDIPSYSSAGFFKWPDLDLRNRRSMRKTKDTGSDVFVTADGRPAFSTRRQGSKRPTSRDGSPSTSSLVHGRLGERARRVRLTPSMGVGRPRERQNGASSYAPVAWNACGRRRSK